MTVSSGRRGKIRLELNKDIFKSFKFSGEDFTGASLVDISHYGMGIFFNDGVSSLTIGQKVSFKLEYGDKSVDIVGVVRHSGAKYAGIHFKKISTNRHAFYDYLDSKIVKKFNIPRPGVLKEFIAGIDWKSTLIIMLIEAIILIFCFYMYVNYINNDSQRLKYLEGYYYQVDRDEIVG